VSGPVFNPRAFAFLDAGGVLVTAHVRGGGEFGKAWWEAGKGRTKPNTWRDLIDACAHLIAEGWTTPAQLAIRGGSAGGIAAGRALTERPDLFAAAVLAVGVLNTLRAEFAPNGPPNVTEYGTIADEQGYHALRAMDSLHAVADGVPYPAVLLTHGMTDSRVEPWMSAKMTARLQAASASEAPVLLRVTTDAGHGIGSTRTQLDEELADVYAFVLWRTNSPPAGAPPCPTPA
jgi:prolyl oligopeptidase